MEPRVVYSTKELLPATNKDVLPALQKSNVIYQFSCHCVSRYVGHTSQRLQDRIKQHVPKSIRSCSSSQKRLLPARRCKSSTQTNTQSLASDSAIGLHLLQNPTCAQHYDDSRFSILAQGRSPFHLSALEATFIKTSNPALCRQKEFVYSLKTKYPHSKGSNQIFHYTRSTPKACSVFAGPICASLLLWATQLLTKKCRSGGESLAKQCPI